MRLRPGDRRGGDPYTPVTMRPPSDADWATVTSDQLPVTDALAWAPMPECGAVVLFCGVVRNHSGGVEGVASVTYEAYERYVEPRLHDVAHEARRRWPEAGRIALLHRTGELGVGDIAVVVVGSAPHRREAFAVAEFCIDTLKATVPIWKTETWEDGTSSVTRCLLDSTSAADHQNAPGTPVPTPP